MRIAPDKLNDLMEFGHVIRVHDDGTVSEPSGMWAPEVYDNTGDDGKEDLIVSNMVGHDWSLMAGYSGQWRYRGPVMHPSEYVGGTLARDILDNPGFYVTVTVGDDGWAVAYQEG